MSGNAVFDSMAAAARAARHTLPELVTFVQWPEDEDEKVRAFFDNEKGATEFAGTVSNALVWSVGVPQDTVVHRVEMVPATFQLVQVKP